MKAGERYMFKEPSIIFYHQLELLKSKDDYNWHVRIWHINDMGWAEKEWEMIQSTKHIHEFYIKIDKSQYWSKDKFNSMKEPRG